jgi:(p)ppGpp synthase/HD superfamily hydrolase
MDKISQALLYAYQLHSKQTRKGSQIPYFSHLMGVASIVMEEGGTADEVTAALLHDAAEDQGGEEILSEIRSRFGETVAEIVAGCSDTFDDPKPPWKERKEKMISKMSTATPSVLLVSIADKLQNIRSLRRDHQRLGNELWSRFKGKKDGTLWYYRSIITALARSGRSHLVDELEREFQMLENQAG